jgi:DNA-binding NarL/FixJ family response regulator
MMAEDHVLVREGLRHRLQKETGFKLIGEASDGQQAVKLVEELKPNVLLLDLSLPRLHGLDIIRRITAETKTKVVVVTMHSDEPYIVEALRSGASAYVLKESTAGELADAIRAVVAGKPYLSSAINPALLQDAKTFLRSNSKDPFDRLTKRERAVFHLAAEGKNSNEIAKDLYISPRTAETHRANLMRKLHLRSQTDLVRLALRKNVISI